MFLTFKIIKTVSVKGCGTGLLFPVRCLLSFIYYFFRQVCTNLDDEAAAETWEGGKERGASLGNGGSHSVGSQPN